MLDTKILCHQRKCCNFLYGTKGNPHESDKEMAQKWNGDTSDVFGEFSRPNSLVNSQVQSSVTQVQNVSPSTSIHSASVNGQIDDSQEMMMQTRNLYSTVGSSSSQKETCLRSLDCNISQNNCQLIGTSTEGNQQSTDEHGPSKDDTGQSQNIVVCFICCCTLLGEKNFLSIKAFMSHSHAPLLVLLMDVLGYKLDNTKLHSEVVCKSCYHLLDIIDELQQTLTESKTDLRTKFLDTVQRLKLKYPRTDKMLKPRCLRCIQMAQSTSRKKRGGRSVRGKGSEDVSRGRGRGRPNRFSSETGETPNEGEMGTLSRGNDVLDCDTNTNPLASDGKLVRGPETQGHASDDTTLNMIFDTDPMFFSPDEKLKAGITRENEGVAVFLCMYCNAAYESAISLKMHVRVYHMPVLIYDNGQGTAETRYRMGIKLQNATSNEFSATEKPYACLFCVNAYKLQSSLQFHFRENHSPLKPYQCPECKESFRRTIELSRHRLYRCPLRKPQIVHPEIKSDYGSPDRYSEDKKTTLLP